MPKGYKIPQSLKDEALEKVALYQSEHKCTLNEAFKVVSSEYNVASDTIQKWFYKSRGKNAVISTVAKKIDKQSKSIAATAISTQSARLQAEKMIYDYIKNLSLFKRILACICGFDKLCYNYGRKKIYQ